MWKSTNQYNGTPKYVHNTLAAPILAHKTTAATYGPVRAKRNSSNNITLSNNKEQHQKMESDKKKVRWHEMYDALLEFRKKHGHCIVPRNYDVKALACWVRSLNYILAFSLPFSSSIVQKS
jgi:hypothetical protein